MSDLLKRGVSVNRARRACVATSNTSREDALAWCVEHAGDQAMDAPLPPPAHRSRGSGRCTSEERQPEEATRAGGAGYGRAAGERGRGTDNEEAVRVGHKTASEALEAYVRARLAALPSKHGGVGGVGNDSATYREDIAQHRSSPEDMSELEFVLSSFKKRAILGEAENRARKLLSQGADLTRFAVDRDYRQVRGRVANHN